MSTPYALADLPLEVQIMILMPPHFHLRFWLILQVQNFACVLCTKMTRQNFVPVNCFAEQFTGTEFCLLFIVFYEAKFVLVDVYSNFTGTQFCLLLAEFLRGKILYL